jgi:hypothetical protein
MGKKRKHSEVQDTAQPDVRQKSNTEAQNGSKKAKQQAEGKKSRLVCDILEDTYSDKIKN